MEKILLIGAGPMAIAYAEVLKEMGRKYVVVTRSEKSASSFNEKTGVLPVVGGLSTFLETNQIEENTLAIIATGTEQLLPNLLLLIDSGIERVLIEKPAAISIEELLNHEVKLSDFSNKTFVAYNRRFYSSVIESQRLIKEDGGLLSAHFEFTEWSHKIEPLEKAPGVKNNWFFANSTHVIDLAFFIAGKPTEWAAFSKQGTLSWHNKSYFSGAGITENGVLFSYLSNWESAGRWSVELLTAKRRIYLKPLEGIEIQEKGTISLNAYDFDDSLDKKFKPGVYLQLKAFLSGDNSRLIDCTEHIASCKDIYKRMLL